MQTKKKTPQLASKVCKDGGIIELIFDGKETRFATWKDGKTSIESLVSINGEDWKPVPASNSLIKHKAILLPSEPLPYGSVDALAKEIEQYLKRYVDLSADFIQVAVAYVLLTWVYEAFNEVCYLRFAGDFGTGKSRALLVLGSICNKPFFASAASTLSPVFHTLDLFRGTLVLDEADFKFSDMRSEIAKIFNNGSVRGFPVLRQSILPDGNFDPKAFHVYGPKIVAMRSVFDDEALESRFLTEGMGLRPLRTDIPLNLPEKQEEEALRLRNMLLMYRFEMLAASGIDAALVDRAQSGRFNQTVVPLLSVVEDADARRTVRSFALGEEVRRKELRKLSIEAELLEVVCELFQKIEGVEALPIGDIASVLRSRCQGESERPLNSRYVGELLRKNLGIYTYKKHGIYVVPDSEIVKIKLLATSFGLDL